MVLVQPRLLMTNTYLVLLLRWIQGSMQFFRAQLRCICAGRRRVYVRGRIADDWRTW